MLYIPILTVDEVSFSLQLNECCMYKYKSRNSRQFLASSSWQIRKLFYDSVPFDRWFASTQAVLRFQSFCVSAQSEAYNRRNMLFQKREFQSLPQHLLYQHIQYIAQRKPAHDTKEVQVNIISN